MAKKHIKANRPKWDTAIMDRLIHEAEVWKTVQHFTPSELEGYKQLLYQERTYHRYALELQKQELADALQERA